MRHAFEGSQQDDPDAATVLAPDAAAKELTRTEPRVAERIREHGAAAEILLVTSNARQHA